MQAADLPVAVYKVRFIVPISLHPCIIKDNKEEFPMKTAVAYRQNYLPRQPLPFPNAAGRRQVLHKFLDILLIAASGVGLAAALMLLLVLV